MEDDEAHVNRWRHQRAERDGPDEEELAEEKLQRKIQRALNPHG